MYAKIINLVTIACLVFFSTVACTNNVKPTLAKSLDAVMLLDSIIIYEKYFTSSGSECTGTFLDRWYGTNLEAENVKQEIVNILIQNSWEKEGDFWYHPSNENGEEIRLIVDVYVPSNIENNRFEYTIPNLEFEKMLEFRTIYKYSSLYIHEFGCMARNKP